MRYVKIPTQDARLIFGLEYALATEPDWTEPLWFLWQCAPTVMLGRHQLVENEVALHNLNGIELVRRMSGGGTIYTAPGCFQFTILCRGDAREVTFAAALTRLTDALRALGAPVIPHGRNDLTIDGKKCSGLAHYGIEDTMVHHGTLLFDLDLDWLDHLLTPDPRKLQAKGIPSVRARCANLAPYLNLPRESFAAHLNTAMTDGDFPLSKSIWKRAEAIARERFGVPEPAAAEGAEMRTGRFPGGLLTARFTVADGKITQISLSGDFFGETEPAISALAECSLTQDAIAAALTQTSLPQGLSPEWLAALLTQAG